METYEFKSSGKTTITLTDETITLSHSGFKNKVNLMASGDTTIFIKDIISVQVKPKTLFAPGILKFNIPFSGLHGALQNNNFINFKKKDEYEMALEIKKKVESLRSSK